MMNKRIATIQDFMDLGASGTKVIDINMKDSISRMTIVFKFTVVTASVLLKNPRECITKIELLDGSKVIRSLTGIEASAVSFQQTKKPPYSRYSLTATDECVMAFPMNFGRYLWDESLALRPEMFDNLQLRISFDEDAANASVVANSCAVFADAFSSEGGKTPVGYLKAYRQYAFTRVASAHEYVDLPTNETIRKIMIVGAMTDYSLLDLIDNFKLSINGDERVPYDIDGNAFAIQQKMLETYSQKIVLDDAVTAKDIYSDFGADNELIINYDDTAFVTAQSKFAEAAQADGSFIDIAASVDIKAVRGVITGRLPFNAIAFDFGDEYMPDQWLNLSPSDKLRADILANSTDPTLDEVSVVVETMEAY